MVEGVVQWQIVPSPNNDVRTIWISLPIAGYGVGEIAIRFPPQAITFTCLLFPLLLSDHDCCSRPQTPR